MVNLDWMKKTVSSDIAAKSPELSSNTDNAQFHLYLPVSLCSGDVSTASPSSCSAYENYLRLPELRKLWSSKEFPAWKNESLLRPIFQGLEITFRFISTGLSDPRPYANRREWKRRLESLTTSQIQLIAMVCEDEEEDARGTAPILDLSGETTVVNGALARDGSYAEVWKLSGETTVVNGISGASLLPRLATWKKAEGIAQKILYSIEYEMHNCPYTLGLGEPNLAGKKNLQYDQIAKPVELHSLRRNPYDHLENRENQTVYSTHQILESWIFAGQELLKRIAERIERKSFKKAASDCYLLEQIWKLLEEIEDLHLLMDPDDFLKLKNQLSIKSSQESEAFCFRSTGLVEMTKECKYLKHKVPTILEVEVDLMGGPRIQEAAMKLYREKNQMDKIHLLQALQSVESAMKRFFFAYQQVLVVIMGSLEAKGNRAWTSSDSHDSLSQIYLEPTCFPSLDAAKTFLGNVHGGQSSNRRSQRKL